MIVLKTAAKSAPDNVFRIVWIWFISIVHLNRLHFGHLDVLSCFIETQLFDLVFFLFFIVFVVGVLLVFIILAYIFRLRMFF